MGQDMSSEQRPLSGIRVLDLSHVLAMPYCTMILGDLGAEVIKVERPVTGDDARHFGPYKEGESAYFMSVNRNKRSVTLDLRNAEAKAVLRDLIACSDVLAENYKPGTLAKLGFSEQEVKAINPRIVYASICGFGHGSVYPGRPGYDIIAQAFSGFMSITGYPENPPTRAGASVGDIISGLFTAVGILASLRGVDREGQGQRLDIAMTDCMLAVLENAVVRQTVAGQTPGRVGSRHPAITPFDVFETANGHVVIAVGNDRLWEMFCQAVPQLAEALGDERFSSNPQRTENHADLKPIIEAWSRTLTSAALVEQLSVVGVPCGPVNTIADVVADPNTIHRDMLAAFDHPTAGHVVTANNPIHFDRTPCKAHRPAPELGQHTEDVMTAVLGYPSERVDELRSSGAFGQADSTS